MPTKICLECASKLVLFYKFKEKCIHSQSVLLSQTKRETLSPVSVHIVDTEADTSSEPAETVAEYYDDQEDPNEIYLEFETESMDMAANLRVDAAIDAHDQDARPSPTNIDSMSSTESMAAAEQFDVEYLDVNEIEDYPTSGKTIPQCHICGQIFSRPYSLVQHARIHTGVKEFTCNLCAAQFTRKAHLDVHLRRHSNVKPFVCETCRRSFTKSSDLLRHQRIHTDEKNYSCGVCAKQFRRSSDVLIHMRSHTGERPYACAVCAKRFAHHTSMRKHERNHQTK